MTHAQLVKDAAAWLRNSRRCYFVSTEHVCTNLSEIPDAIGWASDASVLVECKTSTGDFINDREKHHRSGAGLGQERWFFAPRGVIPKDKLPEGWGLLERQEIGARGHHICRRTVEPILRPPSQLLLLNERKMLVSAAHRTCEALSLVKPFTIIAGDEVVA